MSGFAADWLSLRAGADDRARNPRVATCLAGHFAGREGLSVLDIGAGTGATMRQVSLLLGPNQHWRLVDNDASLLDRAVPPAGVTVERRVLDLADEIDALFDPVPDLITASAFFDLASAAWIDAFVARLAVHRVALYAALTYDGRECWSPPHALDTEALIAFHADQQRDKGLGCALGPDAHTYLAHRLEVARYSVETGASDWDLSAPRDGRLIEALASGSAAAIAPSLGSQARVWARARARSERVMIGHGDIFACPR